MIRFLRAFAWLRWRLLINGVRGSRRRDQLEQISRLLIVIVPIAIVVMSLGSIILVSAAGLIGGYALASGGAAAPDLVILAARALLLGASIFALLLPITGAAQTTSTKYSRLLLLPISIRALHFVEVIAGLADPWILFVLPGLMLFAVGLTWGGRPDAGLFAAMASLALALVLASMAALVSFSVSWVFRNRRRAEILTIIFVMSISAVTLLPQVLDDDAEEGRSGRTTERTRTMTVARIDAVLPDWSAVWPSEAFGRVIASAVVNEDRRSAAAWLGVLVVEGVLLFWLSGLVHRRLLASASGSVSRRPRMTNVRPPWRLPGVTVQAAAVAWVMVKSSLRSVRGRLAVLLPGPMLALVSAGVLRASDGGRLVAMLETHSHLLFGASLLIALFAIQPFTMNQFTSDRAGLTLQLLLPVSALDLVRGKAMGGGVLFLLAASISCVALVAATGGGATSAWVLTAVGGVAAYVTISPLAALMSTLFPVAADLSSAGAGGNPHTASALVGMFAGGAAILPMFVAAAPGLLPISPAGSLVAMCVWLGVVTTVAWTLLGVVSRVVTTRRENLFLTK